MKPGHVAGGVSIESVSPHRIGASPLRVLISALHPHRRFHESCAASMVRIAFHATERRRWPRDSDLSDRLNSPAIESFRVTG